MIRLGKAGYKIDTIVLHTTATPANWADGKTAGQMRDEVDQMHKNRGWRGIGYHGLIAPNGDFAQGRRFDEIGAHVKEYNRHSLGLTLVPTAWIDRMGTFDDWYTADQRATLKSAVFGLMRMIPTITRIRGHNEYSNKLCPGFKVEDLSWYRELE